MPMPPTPDPNAEIPADEEILLETPIETAAKETPSDPEEIENGCQWCDAEQCLHHHTFELPE